MKLQDIPYVDKELDDMSEHGAIGWNRIRMTDTAAPGDYSIAFTNLEEFERAGVAVVDSGRNSVDTLNSLTRQGFTAVILGYYALDTQRVDDGEQYVAYIHAACQNAKVLSLLKKLTEYPLLNEDAYSNYQYEHCMSATPVHVMQAAESGSFVWLYEYLRQYYAETDNEGQYSEDAFMDVIREACAEGKPLAKAFDILSESANWTSCGPEVSAIAADQFNAEVRFGLFQMANKIRREKLFGWKRQWATLPGIQYSDRI